MLSHSLHTRIVLLLLGLGLSTLFPSSYSGFAATEPWADPRLPFTNHLTAWYDASRQSAARGPRSLPPLTSGRLVDTLYDASGNTLHLAQPHLTFRPRFRKDSAGAFLSFDGDDDSLSASQLHKVLTNATVFLVANPRTNAGQFRGFFAANQEGRNDYTTGLNLDLGPNASSQLLFLNAEGAGFNGAQQLLKPPPTPFRRWHLFTLTLGNGPQSVQLHLDTLPQVARDRTPGSVMFMDEFTLGARSYSNTQESPHHQGFLAGDIAELILYQKALTAAERQKVEHYLNDKYGALLKGLGPQPNELPDGAIQLVTVSNPPPVQWFSPGFQIDKLPIELSNINNIRCRPDGTLIAVAYDGKIWKLRDTDGDGLEDQATAFWNTNSIRSPIGATLTPPGYKRGNGMFVAAKDKVTLITDTNGDDVGDTETVVATWTERSEQQGVDALGVAMDKDGSIYFGLGAASYTDAFLIDKTTGQARYRTTMERGTIQRVAPDFSSRETIATGIRFSVGLAFNSLGDLFATDQEGATWLPNGNPLDELLHIEKGRHYGFPPRHPRHLPDVVDEPSVADYAPQHQSTCGLAFNDPVNPNGPTFGPPQWKGDALVTGYSRGKLWRTQLAKTTQGYLSQNHLIATFQSLVADVCVTHRGDLIVATHSGQPDWGSGPNGKGHLFRIRYRSTYAQPAPQITAAWNGSPTELRIAFDRPVSPSNFRDLPRRAHFEQGRFVFAGDRFETIRPGYQVVYDQLNTPRFEVPILSSQLSQDGTLLTLMTPPRTTGWNYAFTLPAPQETNTVGNLPQPIPAWDSLTELHGLEATWIATSQTLRSWWPHPNPEVAAKFTSGSLTHSNVWVEIRQAGELQLQGQLDLYQLLQPAIQPGATLDYTRPTETARVRFQASHPFNLWVNEVRHQSTSRPGDSLGSLSHQVQFTHSVTHSTWLPWKVTLTKPAGPLNLNMTWSTSEDPRWRPMQLHRFKLPWAQNPAQPPSPDTLASAFGVTGSTRAIPELAGGNWFRGRDLFFGTRLACSKCHTHQEQGGRVGPDLTHLHHRDFNSVRKDIQFPNAALNPDHLATTLVLRDNETISVRVLNETQGMLTTVDANAAQRAIPRAEIFSMQPSAISLMPEGIWDAMSTAEQRDLMTFLLTEPLTPHPVPTEAQGQKIPKPRSGSEVTALLKLPDPSTLASLKPVHVVLCASPKDAGHGAPGFHDYPVWRERWTRLLSLAENTTVEAADRWPTEEQWKRADLVAFYHDNPAWVADKARDLDAFLERGGGLVFLHWSMNAYKDLSELTKRLARAWGPGAKFRQGEEQLVLHPGTLTDGLPTLQLVDETYWNLKGDLTNATVVASVVEDGQPQPQIWYREQARGRVLVCIPGHYTWTFDDPLFRILLLRGMAWSAKQPIHRWEALSTIGAR